MGVKPEAGLAIQTGKLLHPGGRGLVSQIKRILAVDGDSQTSCRALGAGPTLRLHFVLSPRDKTDR